MEPQIISDGFYIHVVDTDFNILYIHPCQTVPRLGLDTKSGVDSNIEVLTFYVAVVEIGVHTS